MHRFQEGVYTCTIQFIVILPTTTPLSIHYPLQIIMSFIMDNDLLQSFPFFLTFIFFISFIFKFIKPTTSKKLPPGPWKLPILGNIHNLVGGGLPHHCIRQLSQKYGPLMHLKLGEMSAMVVSSAQIAKEVLKTHETVFAERPRFVGVDIVTYGCTSISFSPYGGYWKQLRKICTLELLSAKRVRSFQHTREAEVFKLLRYISAKAGSTSTINLGNELLSMTYSITARTAFGDKCKDQDIFIAHVKELMKIAVGFSVSDMFPSQKWLHSISGMKSMNNILVVVEMHRKIDMVLQNIINSATITNIDEVGDDSTCLLHFLLNHRDDATLDFPLTIDNIKAVILDIFVAGSETSSTTTEWAFSEMLKNPRVLKKAQAEVREVLGSRGYVDEAELQKLEYLKAIIKETLRLHPPGPLLAPRQCRETCEVNGYTIPKGSTIFVNAWAIGRDPMYWSEAERFLPERFMDCPIDYKGSHFEFIPFGAGKRICPGISYGVANILLPLSLLIYYFDWELPFGTTHENLDMTENFGASVRRKNDLFLVPISHNNVPMK